MITNAALSQVPVQAEQPESKAHALSGWATAIDGQWALVASPQKDKGDLLSVGELTVYRYTDGTWQIHQTIQPDGLSALSNFGISVALDYETALVGSIGDHQNALFSGVIFVYEPEDGNWVYRSTLKGSGVKIGQLFGYSANVKGDLIIAGAYMGDGVQPKSGVVYVFEKSGGLWTETAILSADNGKTGDAFGYTTHIIDENTVAIGAYRSGKVYIFSKSGNEWVQTAVLSDPSGQENNSFGYSITSMIHPDLMGTDQTILFAGAPRSTAESGQTGAIVAFLNTQNEWEYAGRISRDDLVQNSHFGVSLTTGGDSRLYAGASRTNSENNREAGSVYEYAIELSENNLIPSLSGEINAVSKESFSHFGAVISASNEFLIISSPYMDRDEKINAGAVYFYSQVAVSAEEISETIRSFELFQNYPNPFNPSTIIKYQLPIDSRVRLEVFDMIGRRVAVLVNEQVQAGRHEIRFDARHLSSGIYIYRLTAGDKVFTKKLTLIK